MSRACFTLWPPEALAISLHLAFLIGLIDAGNDNGSLPLDRASSTSGLAVGGGDEHRCDGDTEGGREAAQKEDREMHAALDALDRRRVDADALGELGLAPFPADPKLSRP
jgi:hypothetical protein